MGEKTVHFPPRFLERAQEDLVLAFESLDRAFGARRATHQRFVTIRVAVEAIALANHHQGECQAFGIVFWQFRNSLGKIAPFILAHIGERGHAGVGKQNFCAHC